MIDKSQETPFAFNQGLLTALLLISNYYSIIYYSIIAHICIDMCYNEYYDKLH